MATKVFSWCTQRCLSCCEVPTTVVVCVPMAIVAEETDAPYGVVVGTLTAFRASTVHDSCGACGYVYTISYDDSQLAEGYELSQQYVNDVICDKCLISFVLNTVDMGITCADVPNCQEPLLVEDTESVDLSINPTIVQTLRADVKISADAGNIITIEPDGLYAATPASTAWELLGNAGTVDGVNFLGTTDNVAHDIRVNNLRARRTVPNATAPQIIDGAPSNAVTAGLAGCSILSGEANTINTVGRSGVICGGRSNTLFRDAPASTTSGMSFIGGGYDNFIDFDPSTPWLDVLPATGQAVICGGFVNGIDGGDQPFIGGGVFNQIIYQPGTVQEYVWGDNIVGGDSNVIFGEFQAGSTRADTLGLNAHAGGVGNNIQNGLASTNSGGFFNALEDTWEVLFSLYAYPEPTNRNGPWGANIIVGGHNNLLTYTQRCLVGGYTNLIYGEDCSAILSGALNQIVATVQAPVLDYDNLSDSVDPQNANGVGNTIVGGEANYIEDGRCSTIAGGAFLKIGANTFGFQSAATRTFTNADNGGIQGGDRDRVGWVLGTDPLWPPSQVDVSAFSGIAYFGDLDLWVANTDNDARKLKLFEPNTDLDFSSTHYTSFEAQAQSANIEYVMPAAGAAVGNVLQATAVAGVVNTLSWTADSSLLGKLTAGDFNSTADQAITINAASYYITAILVTNSSINLTTAAGGIYAAAAKVTPLVEAATVYTTCVVASDALFIDYAQNAAFVNANMQLKVRNEATIYLSLTTPQGAAATADIYVYGKRLS